MPRGWRKAVLWILLLLPLPGSAATSTIGILVFDGFLTSDVTAPVEVFGAATKKAWFSSYRVVLVSVGRNRSVVSEEGLRVTADRTIYDAPKLDVLLVPSAYSMEPLLRNRDLLGFIRVQAKSASWLASNCSGAFLLAATGAVDGKRATTWAGGEKSLADAYPAVKVQVDQNVVVDDRVITSNGGPVSYQAAFQLLARLSSEAFAREVAEQIQFDRLARAFPR